MGVDYDPVLVAGWQIEIPEHADDHDEWMNALAKSLGLSYSKAGDGNYGGEDRWYITYTESDLALDKLHDLSRAVAAVEKLMREKDIQFSEFQIIADLHVW